mmetsp:Transcript_2991/g.11535  ORF Transcript_2991/g.11535 Transcript_2991/m.11535 type:complete len:609 (-) Transcript_2991:2345-4171(-)
MPELANVAIASGRDFHAFAVGPILNPLTGVGTAVAATAVALAVHLAEHPRAVEDSAIDVVHPALSIRQIPGELPIVAPAVGPDLQSVAKALLADPLTHISRSIAALAFGLGVACCSVKLDTSGLVDGSPCQPLAVPPISCPLLPTRIRVGAAAMLLARMKLPLIPAALLPEEGSAAVKLVIEELALVLVALCVPEPAMAVPGVAPELPAVAAAVGERLGALPLEDVKGPLPPVGCAVGVGVGAVAVGPALHEGAHVPASVHAHEPALALEEAARELALEAAAVGPDLHAIPTAHLVAPLADVPGPVLALKGRTRPQSLAPGGLRCPAPGGALRELVLAPGRGDDFAAAGAAVANLFGHCRGGAQCGVKDGATDFLPIHPLALPATPLGVNARASSVQVPLPELANVLRAVLEQKHAVAVVVVIHEGTLVPAAPCVKELAPPGLHPMPILPHVARSVGLHERDVPVRHIEDPVAREGTSVGAYLLAKAMGLATCPSTLVDAGIRLHKHPLAVRQVFGELPLVPRTVRPRQDATSVSPMPKPLAHILGSISQGLQRSCGSGCRGVGCCIRQPIRRRRRRGVDTQPGLAFLHGSAAAVEQSLTRSVQLQRP